MTTTPTSNKALTQITAGTESGTWGPFVNATTSLLDNAFGATATVPVNNSNVILSSAQYQCNGITFTGTLGANITVTLPSVGSFYTVKNLVTNPTAFQVVLTAGAGQKIGVPWGQPVGIMTDGVNVKFRNLRKVGTYIDFASSAVPDWINHCTIPPYLLCDGSAFSSATYPYLSDILKPVFGSNVVPDCRGRTRFSLDDGTGRFTVAGSSQVGAVGGSQTETITTSSSGGVYDIPSLPIYLFSQYFGGFGSNSNFLASVQTPTPVTNMPPYVVSGVTMIRAG